MSVGQIVVYHNPTSGQDQPGVISAQTKVGDGKEKRTQISLLIFGFPTNEVVEDASPGNEPGEFESAAR
jgi:hypothetical protein